MAATRVAIAGLASLFTSCVETVDSLLSAPPDGAFGDHVRIEIEIEKVRLMAWGEVIGLTPSTSTMLPTPGLPSDVLRQPAMRSTIQTMLVLVIDIFDTEDLPELYGISKNAGGTFAPRPERRRETLEAVFPETYSKYRDYLARYPGAAAQKFRYSIEDESKFMALISELSGINDNLGAMFPRAAEGVEAQLLADVVKCDDRDMMERFLRAANGLPESVMASARQRYASLPERSTPAAPAAASQATPSTVPAPDPGPGPGPTQPAAASAVPNAPAESHRKFVGTSSASSAWQHQGPSQPPPAQSVQTLPIHPKPVEQKPSPSPTSYPSQTASSVAPYDDTGALFIHRTNLDDRSLILSARHVGISEIPAAYIRPLDHPSFGHIHMPKEVYPLAEKLFEMEPEADPGYSGPPSLPGTITLRGFTREYVFWRMMEVDRGERTSKGWLRNWPGSSISAQVMLDRWEAIHGGLGADWTEKKGYDDIRHYVGNTNFEWINPQERFKTRHQISDLLGNMQRNVTPHLETTTSIGSIALRQQLDPDAQFGFADFLLQILLAREVLLRLEREGPGDGLARNRFGLTDRIVYDMVASVLWHRNLEQAGGGDFQAAPATRAAQMDGISRFVDALDWPFGGEVRARAAEIAGLSPDELQVGVRTWDWMNGLLVPGSFFALATLGAVYELSATLRLHLPDKVVKLRHGLAGLVFPARAYWSTRCPVAKVLAPLAGVRQACGWVGPTPAPVLPGDAGGADFGRILEVRAAPPPFPRLSTNAPAPAAPVPAAPGVAGPRWDEAVPPRPAGEVVTLTALRLSEHRDPQRGAEMAPTFDASVEFTVRGAPAVLALRTNVLFVAAVACRGNAPHRIPQAARTAYRVTGLESVDLPGREAPAEGEDGPIVVIHAAGGHANEVLARAWCCQVGRNAVVWKEGGGCCFKCALLMASKEGLGLGVVIVS